MARLYETRACGSGRPRSRGRPRTPHDSVRIETAPQVAVFAGGLRPRTPRDSARIETQRFDACAADTHRPRTPRDSARIETRPPRSTWGHRLVQGPPAIQRGLRRLDQLVAGDVARQVQGPPAIQRPGATRVSSPHPRARRPIPERGRIGDNATSVRRRAGALSRHIAAN